MSFDSLSGSKKRKVREEPFLIPENAKIISIDDDDNEGSEQCDEKMFEGVFDVKKEVKSGGSGKFYAKDGTVENPITIISDEYGESDEKHSKKRKLKEEPFVVHDNSEVIFFDIGDEKMFVDGYDVTENVKIDESGKFDAKDGKFVDEKCGWTLENPITIQSDDEHSVSSDSNDDEEEENYDNVKQGEKSGASDESADKDIFFVDLDDSDESDEEHSVGSASDSDSDSNSDSDDDDDNVQEGAKSGGSGEFADKDNFFVDLDDSDESDEEHCFDSDESEENETSDEDFRVDELNEISDNDDDSSSDNDGKEKEKKKGGRKYDNVAEELLREAIDRHNGISEMNNEEVKDKSPSIKNDEVEHSDYGSVATSTTFEKKGSSSNKNDTSKKQKAKSVENVSDDDVNVAKAKERAKPNETVNLRDDVNVAKAKCKSHVKAKDNAKPYESVDVSDSDEGKEHVKGLDAGGVSLVQTKQEMIKESRKQKMVENKGRDYKGIANIHIEKKNESIDNNGLIQSVKSTHFMWNELLLAKCYWDSMNTMKNDSTLFEFEEDGVDRQDTQPQPVSVETPPSIWSLKKVEKVQKTMEEEENEVLWDELDTVLRESDAVSMIGNLGTNEATNIKSGSPSSRCEHDTFLDEEIGVYCKLCGVVITEIKYISPLVVERFPCEGSGRKASFDGVNVSLFDGSQFNVSDKDSETNFSRNEGTVWDLIPDLIQTLYPHQQEGFEFIWKNLAGSVKLQKLKNVDPCSEGGCIISHAPGTGKTRLTIVFLKAYLKAFPKCLPIIVAPASILLTWEDEFKKWDIGVPFHNLSNPELSGKEHADAVETFDRSNTQHNIHETRMAKLISWFKETSILGISYNLFGKKCQDKKKLENVKERKGNCDMRKILLKSPGLLVLDEGHTPRNQRSHIWKVLSKIQAQKRIILSGTPFQNNFWELYSTLSLVKPSFPNTIPPELKSFCHKQGHKSSKKRSCEPVSGNTTRDPSDDKIKKLKMLMDPFVHVHKGAILENKLPGLRDCLVTLKADSLQNEILKSIKRSQNTIFNFERKIALTSVHPSLFLECSLSEEEESALDKDQLEKLRLNPHEGVKTKFLFEFVRLCDAFHEKVLVFSQFHAPLQLIKDQLTSAFKWSEGKEVLFMSGKDPPKVKQSVIHSFNDANCQAKVLLASTKACSEGISLVGASRVVLLDVVWNPSVERQAISRAYRIGQKRVVYTYHLLAEGTTEEEKYGKQAEKDRLSELVFSEKNATDIDEESKSCAGNFEDRVLDQMTRHENLKDMFVKCVVLRKERDVV
ncbi:putative DNA helicase chromatin remodeling SNF2 family [Medicago truncatula]|nr:putative DNA helicase chromatin remodeling SNF2 family [Medicago truncatula]